MRKMLLLLGFCLIAAQAGAQTQPLTSQEITQQANGTIQKSTNSLNQAMTQQQIGQIEQDQREQKALSLTPGYAGNPVDPVPAYLTPPPPKPAPPPKPPAP